MPWRPARTATGRAALSPMVLRRLPSPASRIRIASLIRMPTSYRANLRRTLKSRSRSLPNDQLWELLEPLLPPWPDEDARSTAGAGSAVPAGHLVRAAYRDRPGRPSAGTRLKVRHDVPAADQAVDQCRGVRRSASDPACPAERGKRDRLVPGSIDGSCIDTKKGVRTWSSPSFLALT